MLHSNSHQYLAHLFQDLIGIVHENLQKKRQNNDRVWRYQ